VAINAGPKRCSSTGVLGVVEGPLIQGKGELRSRAKAKAESKAADKSVRSTHEEWGSIGFDGAEGVPGFAVGFVEAAAAAAVGVDEEGGGVETGDGDDVPGVAGDDVGDEEVDVCGGVDGAGVAAGGGVDAIASSGAVGGGFDLHAVKALAGVGDEVVAAAVAVGLGDDESAARGLHHEHHFDEFAALFGVEVDGGAGFPFVFIGGLLSRALCY
jgi:hypothetical protein